MKKFVSILLSTAFAATMAVPAFAAGTFSDVKGNYAWAYEYVEDMAEKGLISGYEDGTFRPQNTVSRMEAFALFARMMGSNNDVNSDVVEAAKKKYASVLKKYSLSYAEGDVAFMLHRGVLSEKELDTYFAGSKKSQAMPRYEAAILITKAMLAEKDATSEVLIDMDYSDAGEIPKDAKQYVYYVSQKGIMSGMGDGTFSPSTSVLRGQIAVMLSKTASSSNYYFETAKIVSVDTGLNNIMISDYNSAIGYSEETKIYKDGEPVTDVALCKGQTVAITYNEDHSGVKVAFIDIISAEVDETKAVIFKNFSSSGGKLMISATDAMTGTTTAYECSANVIVTIDGEVKDINKLTGGEYVTLGLAGGTVVEVTSMQKSETIKDATLEQINPMGSITISHKDSNYDGKTYVLSGDAKVIKNGDISEFTALYRGDTLTIKLEYGVVANINATSVKKTVTGTLKAYTISSSPTLTLRVNGADVVYDIPADVEIKINNEKAKLSDFEIGSEVTVTIESDAIKSVKASSSAGTMSGSMLSGVVTNVNQSAKVVIITDANGETMYVTCKDSTNIYVVPSLNQYTLKQIKIGDSVVAYGSYQNGIFVCTGMTVTPSVN